MFVSEFDLDSYLDEIGSNIHEYGATLPSVVANKVLEKLGILKYLSGQNCSSTAISGSQLINGL